MKIKLYSSILLSSLAISFSFNTVAAAEEARSIDPYEKYNRFMFQINEAFDILVLKPAATLYNTIMPKPLNKGVNNFFKNLELIPTVINDVLQANLYQAANDTWRFGVNSTVGIAGFFDFATPIGLTYNYEDIGLTFAQWGYKNSNYLVLPLIGASTIRDGIGWVPYYYITVFPYIKSRDLRYEMIGAGILVLRAEFLRYRDVEEQAAFDKYVFMRDAYLQRRAHRIAINAQGGKLRAEQNGQDGEVSIDDVPKNDASKDTEAKNNVTKSDTSKNDATKNDVSKKNASKNNVLNNDESNYEASKD
ncbi:MAG: VacJ family lipoprotein [Gammaproteobacteria bacterium]|nr:VacJ family lipoprotein [Gammaproteobacteria bacterium]